MSNSGKYPLDESGDEHISNVKECIDEEYATNRYAKQIRQGKIRKEYSLSHFYGYKHKCLKR